MVGVSFSCLPGAWMPYAEGVASSSRWVAKPSGTTLGNDGPGRIPFREAQRGSIRIAAGAAARAQALRGCGSGSVRIAYPGYGVASLAEIWAGGWNPFRVGACARQAPADVNNSRCKKKERLLEGQEPFESRLWESRGFSFCGAAAAESGRLPTSRPGWPWSPARERQGEVSRHCRHRRLPDRCCRRFHRPGH